MGARDDPALAPTPPRPPLTPLRPPQAKAENPALVDENAKLKAENASLSASMAALKKAPPPRSPWKAAWGAAAVAVEGERGGGGGGGRVGAAVAPEAAAGGDAAAGGGGEGEWRRGELAAAGRRPRKSVAVHGGAGGGVGAEYSGVESNRSSVNRKCIFIRALSSITDFTISNLFTLTWWYTPSGARISRRKLQKAGPRRHLLDLALGAKNMPPPTAKFTASAPLVPPERLGLPPPPHAADDYGGRGGGRGGGGRRRQGAAGGAGAR